MRLPTGPGRRCRAGANLTPPLPTTIARTSGWQCSGRAPTHTTLAPTPNASPSLAAPPALPASACTWSRRAGGAGVEKATAARNTRADSRWARYSATLRPPRPSSPRITPTPSAGLFDAAIIESGSYSFWSHLPLNGAAKDNFDAVTAALNCTGPSQQVAACLKVTEVHGRSKVREMRGKVSLAHPAVLTLALKAASAEELVEAQGHAPGLGLWAPTVDGQEIPSDPDRMAAAGNYSNKVRKSWERARVSGSGSGSGSGMTMVMRECGRFGVIMTSGQGCPCGKGWTRPQPGLDGATGFWWCALTMSLLSIGAAAAGHERP